MPVSDKTKESLSWRDKFAALKYIFPFLKLIWRTHPAMVAENAVSRLVKAVLPALILYIGKLIVDEVIALSSADLRDYDSLILFVGLELLLVFISDFLSRRITLLDSLIGDLFANESSVSIMKHAASMDLPQFEDAVFYDKLERARRQTTSRSILLGQVMGQLQDIVTILFLGAGVVFFIPWLIPVLFLSVIPSFLGETHFNARSYSLIRNWTPQRRTLDYLRYIGASDETAKEVKVFDLSDFITNRFKTLADKFYKDNKSLAVQRFRWGILLSLLGTFAYYLAYAIILMNAVTGAITIGDLIFLSGSFSKMKSLMEGILNKFSTVAENALYLSDFFDFFNIRPNIVPPNQPVAFPHPVQVGFELVNVGFKYPNSEQWALRGVDMKIEAGDTIALVGENGSGKTTLIKLLTRMYDPTEGHILLDGVGLDQYHPADLRSEIGVIFQDFVRFSLIAKENIAVGKIPELKDFSRIQNAAVSALADQVIDGLPGQYDQMIGRRFADGVDLSGGQWQKVALARAYMRDAQIMILDEPTAALDAKAEHEIFEHFTKLTDEKTSILISHRFGTVRMANKIFVLENGQLIEQGSHEDLLEIGGKYAELFNLQARGYQ